MLRQVKIKDLVDSTIPRPQEDDPNFEKWEILSIAVGNWLTLQTDFNILGELRSSAYTLHYADDVWNAIKGVVTVLPAALRRN